MKKSLLLLLALLFSWSMGTYADEFRPHRYDLFKYTPLTPDHILFVGNSITNQHPWQDAWGSPLVLNRGVSAATSSEVLANVESFIDGHPQKVFIMIGTNDGMGSTAQVPLTVDNIRQAVRRIVKESPETKVYVQSLLESNVSPRTVSVIEACNAALQKMVEEEFADANVEYVDLYSHVTGIIDGTVSLDALHLTAPGYVLWMDYLYASGAMDGFSCQYDPNDIVTTDSKMDRVGNQDRNTYFGSLKVEADDVLFVGDEMVNGGCWSLLLGNEHVKNRGYSFWFAGPDMAYTAESVPYIFGRTGSEAPRQVLLYIGSEHCSTNTSNLETMKSKYETVLAAIRERAPEAKISLVSVLPNATQARNQDRVVPFNAFIKSIADADETGQLEYIDLYTDLSNGSDQYNPLYMTGNFVSGLGYVHIANILAGHIEGCSPLSEEEALARANRLTARTALWNAIEECETVRATYTLADADAFQARVDQALAVLQKQGGTQEEIEAETQALTDWLDTVDAWKETSTIGTPATTATALADLAEGVTYAFKQAGDFKAYYMTTATVGSEVYMRGENCSLSTSSVWQLEGNATDGWRIRNLDGLYIGQPESTSNYTATNKIHMTSDAADAMVFVAYQGSGDALRFEMKTSVLGANTNLHFDSQNSNYGFYWSGTGGNSQFYLYEVPVATAVLTRAEEQILARAATLAGTATETLGFVGSYNLNEEQIAQLQAAVAQGDSEAAATCATLFEQIGERITLNNETVYALHNLGETSTYLYAADDGYLWTSTKAGTTFSETDPAFQFMFYNDGDGLILYSVGRQQVANDVLRTASVAHCWELWESFEDVEEMYVRVENIEGSDVKWRIADTECLHDGGFLNAGSVEGGITDYYGAASNVRSHWYIIPVGEATAADLYQVEQIRNTAIVTGICHPAEATPASSATFDLSGRRVQHPAAGIYIRGGRKILVR